jgi:hypothetical protein
MGSKMASQPLPGRPRRGALELSYVNGQPARIPCVVASLTSKVFARYTRLPMSLCQHAPACQPIGAGGLWGHRAAPKGAFMRKTLKVEYLNLISNARMALHDVADH